MLNPPPTGNRCRARSADTPARARRSSILRRSRVICTSTERSSPAPVRLASSSRLTTSPVRAARMRINATSASVSRTGAPSRESSPRALLKLYGPKLTSSRRLAAIGHGAAQDGVDAQRQFRRLERLGDIIVGANRKPANTILGHAARGEQHDRHIRGAPHALGQRKTVLHRHHHVEDQQIEIHRRQQLAGAGRVGGGRDARAGLRQIALQQIADAVIVIHQQQVGRAVERVEGGWGHAIGAAL